NPTAAAQSRSRAGAASRQAGNCALVSAVIGTAPASSSINEKPITRSRARPSLGMQAHHASSAAALPREACADCAWPAFSPVEAAIVADPGGPYGRSDDLYRKQELCLVVAARLADAETYRRRLRRGGDPALSAGQSRDLDQILAVGAGTGAASRRH